MKRVLCALATSLICLILFSPLSSPASRAAEPADSARAAAPLHPPLWMQAVSIFELNKDLVPGKVSQKIQELEKDGRVKSETDVDVALALDGAGKIKTEVLKASKDGKDITAEQRKKVDEAAKKQAKEDAAKKSAKKDAGRGSDEHSHSFSLEDTPFNPERQDEVRVTETTRGETIDGTSCACFEFSYPEKRPAGAKGKPATIKGKAWIEESSGHPVKLEYVSDPLPKHVKSMSTTLRYGADANDAWVVKEMIFEARGSFLFFGKAIRGDISLGDYWKYIEPASQK